MPFVIAAKIVEMTEEKAVQNHAHSHRLVLVAVSACLITFFIATVYPAGRPADETMTLPFAATYGWIAFQCVTLILPGLLLGLLVCQKLPRVGSLLGSALILLVPLIVLCDAMTFTWIAERFLSGTMGRIVTTLLPSLLLHVSRSEMVQAVAAVVLGALAVLLIWKLSGRLGRNWHAKPDSVSPLATTGVLALVATLIALPAFLNLKRTTGEMARASVRHPFCVFHFIGYHGVGLPSPVGDGAVLNRLAALRAVPATLRREARQLSLSVSDELDSTIARPNVIVVVIECFRPEIINPEVMPNLHAFAQKSIYCRNNFSSGNATCFGMFSLFTGLEAVWFERKVANQPIMNRLLKQAGYKLGFYGGQTDWRHYGMAGFVREELYDDFQIELPELPDSDLRTVDRTLRFIDQDTDSPRAAIAYMFATHSSYSDPEDQVFQPAASDNILISHSPEMRDQIFNRYKNSVRTMDRMIKPLLREDCTVIVIGDHGEPYLDDGTAVHGTRLSRFQNMTPALVYSPGLDPRTIDQPTSHADLLPTLLSVLQIPTSDPSVFDGLDLTSVQDQDLAERMFVSRNYLGPASVLVGPWTLNKEQPFGYRAVFNISRWQASYLNPIDDGGLEWETIDSPDPGPAHFQRWIADRFGEDSIESSADQEKLFTEFLSSPLVDVQLAALEIAGEVAQPQPYLYDLVAKATRAENNEVRRRAKELVIVINRRRGASQ
ncbi:MAG: sulfatase-like hydrolase/transferase [Rubripirellula sp.]